jgi:RNA polymerase sigma-70 factor (ECF subfamily)
MDVLGYSLEEIGDIMESSIPSVKAVLHRGRERLRKPLEPDDTPPPALAEPERTLLAAYVDRFNDRDFDAIREMLAEEARLELVSKSRMEVAARWGDILTTTPGCRIGCSFPDGWAGPRPCR